MPRLTHPTERRGWVIKIPASYLGGPGSNLGLETGYPTWGFLCYFSVPQAKGQDSALK
jgi:hypothetical protein